MNNVGIESGLTPILSLSKHFPKSEQGIEEWLPNDSRIPPRPAQPKSNFL
jgi:hypothetical protein